MRIVSHKSYKNISTVGVEWAFKAIVNGQNHLSKNRLASLICASIISSGVIPNWSMKCAASSDISGVVKDWSCSCKNASQVQKYFYKCLQQMTIIFPKLSLLWIESKRAGKLEQQSYQQQPDKPQRLIKFTNLFK